MTNATLLVRDGTQEDAAYAEDLDFRAHVTRNPAYKYNDGLQDVVLERGRAPRSHFVLAELDGRRVGTAIASPAYQPDPRRAPSELAHVSAVAVEPDCWGRGVAEAMMRELERRLAADGYRRVQLWTQSTNARALALYRRLGFERTAAAKEHCGEEICLLTRDLV